MPLVLKHFRYLLDAENNSFLLIIFLLFFFLLLFGSGILVPYKFYFAWHWDANFNPPLGRMKFALALFGVSESLKQISHAVSLIILEYTIASVIPQTQTSSHKKHNTRGATRLLSISHRTFPNALYSKVRGLS